MCRIAKTRLEALKSQVLENVKYGKYKYKTVHYERMENVSTENARRHEFSGVKNASRACERSGKRSGAGGKWGEREWSGEWVLKNKLSGAESGLNRPLKVRSHQHCVNLVTDILR